MDRTALLDTSYAYFVGNVFVYMR